MKQEIYPDRIQELIIELRSHLNGVISPSTTKQEKIGHGWQALEKLRLIEMDWHGECERSEG